MDVLATMRPLRARLLVDGSIEAEGTVPGVELPVKLSIGRLERRALRSGVNGMEIDLSAQDPTSVLVREAIYKEIVRLQRRGHST